MFVQRSPDLMITAFPCGKPSQCEQRVNPSAGAKEPMRSRVTHYGEPSADVRFCLLFPREALSVPVMRRVLGDILSRLGVDESSISDLLLAVTEACTNVLRHSGQRQGYEIIARVTGNRCQLQVVDRGRGFDPNALAVRRPVVRRPVRRVAALRRRHGLGAPGLAHLGHAAPPDRPAAAADPPPRRGPAARVRPRHGHHAGLRRRRHAEHRPRSGHGGVPAEAHRLARRRAGRYRPPAAAQGRRLTR